MQFWNELEARIIDERYPLRRLIRSEGRTAWFATEVGNGASEPAVISLTESLTDADEVKARLQAAQKIKDPNLLEIRKVGQASLDQTVFVYAIMEPSDQNLSDVLRQQTLSKDEARQVAEAMVGALTAIHKQGLTHGHVEPESIFGVGDAVKLRSDCLQSPGSTRAGDIAGIGATLFQSFMQRQASSADDAQINRIPAPFAEIVRNSLSSRWSLAQIAAALRPPTLPAIKSAPSAAMPIPAVPASRPAPEVPLKEVAAKNDPLPREEVGEEIEETPSTSSLKKPIYAALAVIVLAILGWIIFRPKAQVPDNPGSQGIVANPVPSPSPAPVPVPVPSPARVPRTKPSAVVPRTAQNSNQPESAGASDRSVWRVVAYTYHHQDQAEHKAEEIGAAHADLQASAFNPKGDSNHFLVVLGGAMDRKEAFRMLQKARNEGIASDAYVQNFSD